MKAQSQKMLAQKDRPARNFGLTEAEFTALVQQLRQGDDTLYRQVFLAYFSACVEYLCSKHKVPHEMAYDATMDALLDFCHRLRSGKVRYGNLRFLFSQMAGQRLSRLRDDQRSTISLEEGRLELLADLTDEESRQADLAFAAAWQQLGEGCQRLLAGFYYHQATLRELASEAGRHEGAVRKQKQRCIEKLRHLFSTVYQP
jgi:RNA polymerase sigma factor (sigma-70 family)